MSYASCAAEIIALVNSSPRSPTSAEIEKILARYADLSKYGSNSLADAIFALEDVKGDAIYEFRAPRDVDKLSGGAEVPNWKPTDRQLLILAQIFDLSCQLRSA